MGFFFKLGVAVANTLLPSLGRDGPAGRSWPSSAHVVWQGCLAHWRSFTLISEGLYFCGFESSPWSYL